MGDIDSLAQSMADIGLLHPVVRARAKLCKRGLCPIIKTVSACSRQSPHVFPQLAFRDLVDGDWFEWHRW
jgi:hypothetical protein